MSLHKLNIRHVYMVFQPLMDNQPDMLLGVDSMHSSILKYFMAIATIVTLTQSQADMVPSSSINHENDNSRLATRVLNKEAQSFNSNFTNLTSLSITDRSDDKVCRDNIAA